MPATTVVAWNAIDPPVAMPCAVIVTETRFDEVDVANSGSVPVLLAVVPAAFGIWMV